MTLEILAVQGIPEVVVGDSLAELIVAHAPSLLDGDVLVVTSKVVSKAEGQVVDGDRELAIDAETVRVVARRGDTRIVATRHGFVMAAAGVDASNVTKGEVVVLPVDSDASARLIRDGVRTLTGANVGVVVSDTFGRPWRVGVTDAAVGFAGLEGFDDLRGTVDPYGNDLRVTLTCTVDELAAAADLVKGKTNGVPVAIVRGLAIVLPPESPDVQGISGVVRPIDEDLFSLGTRDVLPARVDAVEFTGAPVDAERVTRALQAASLAAHPSGWHSLRFTVLPAIDFASMPAFADADVLASAATVIVPHLDDETTARDLLASGAAIENVLVALAIEQLGSCWIWPSAADAEGLPDYPLGIIAVGQPATS
ncbi:MAG TPA: coenzyme F420-0:L-glutamate ligase [Acidothermaceae bacterium]|jgi:coenzyme F420-0:L-glutamate ligase/coenzyme F420-1:gamma-L-glutamate ligase